MKFMTQRKQALLTVATLVSAALSTAGIATPASAVDKPQDAQITLISPVLNDNNTSEAAQNQAMANGWVANGWFGTGLKYQRAFAPVGSTINLVYHVADKDGKPLVGQDVRLRINKGYCQCTSIVEVDGVKTKGIDKPPTDQANVTHKTDQFGNVSFVMKNLDTVGELQPASLTDAPNTPDPTLDDLHSQVLPEVAGEKPDHSVITEFHYYTPDAEKPLVPLGSSVNPEIRLAGPALTDDISIHRTDLEQQFSVDNNWYAPGMTMRQAYVKTGSTNILTYLLKDDAGNPMAGATVKLHVNKGYSGSNAKVTDGKTPAAASSTSSATDGAIWEGVTDPFGSVIFTLKNTDTKGEVIPATLTTPVPLTGSGAVFTQLYPEFAGQASDKADMTEFHFIGNVAPVTPPVSAITVKATSSKTVKKVKGKTVVSYFINVTIGKAVGKAATITIGTKKSIKRVMSTSQVFKFPTTKGKKSVKVLISGKTFSYSVTVK